LFYNEKYKKQKDVKITEKYLQLHGQWTRIVSEELLKDNLKTITRHDKLQNRQLVFFATGNTWSVAFYMHT